MEQYKIHPITKYLRTSVIEEYNMDGNKTLVDNISNLVWGTYGRSGKEKLHFVKLESCTTSHLKAILYTQKWLDFWFIWCINHILKQRDNIVPDELFDMEK